MVTVAKKNVHTRNGHIGWLDRERARELFDREAQRYMKMSGDEFIRKWNAGGFGDDLDRPEILNVASLLPLVQ